MNEKMTAKRSSRQHLKATLSKAIVKVEPIIKPLEITKNGNYSATENVHGFNPVNVNVPLKYEEGYNDGYQASQDSIKLQEKTATENGEVVTDEGFTGMSKVIVAVPIKEEQTKTLDVSENGTIEIVPDEGKTLSKVTANVAVNPTDIGKPYIDSSKITYFQFFFSQNPLLLNDIDKIDTSNGTIFNYMFSQCTTITTIPLLNTSKGTSFSYMFRGCSRLTEIPLIDTSNGIGFDYMFTSCTKLTKIPQINTSKGTNFNYMFSDCGALVEVPLLDITSGRNFACTFDRCYRLETVSLTTANSSLSTNTFSACSALKNLTIGEGWAVNIYLHYSNNLTVESLHGMIENLADLTGKTAKTFQIGATNLAKIDEAHIEMLKAKNWNYS